MEIKYVLLIENRKQWRDWLKENCKTKKEIWINAKRVRPDGEVFSYIDAVEEAICFGWIDSVFKKEGDLSLQRFSPRAKNSPWTELNKERARRLIKLGLMEKEGYEALPPLGERSFKMDEDIELALKKARAYKAFISFHPLYQRVRAYNVSFAKKLGEEAYEKALSHLIAETKKGKTYGEWNDFGRLLNY